jgi:hypothetical protein
VPTSYILDHKLVEDGEEEKFLIATFDLDGAVPGAG